MTKVFNIFFNKNIQLFPCFLFLASGFIFSCNKHEPIPAYIHIPSFNIQATQGFGSASSNISDVWVYENDNLQGVYELPVTFPILSSGNTKLKLLAGIKMNGIATTRIAYPFYTFYETTVDLQPTETDTILPEAQYMASANLVLKEDFEMGNDFNNMQRIIDTLVAFEGNSCGRLALNEGDSILLAFSGSRFNIPFLSQAVFVEMDYKNNAEFVVGLRGYLNAQAITVEKLTITPKDSWNKIYINFTPEVGRIQAAQYELIIKYVKKTNVNPADIYFDNIKVLFL
jgi:hypothetical protein